MKKIKSRKRRIQRRILCKWVVVVILILVSFSQVSNVEAGLNDTTIKMNRMDGIYAVTNLNGQDRIFYLNMYQMNGKVSYCIELGVNVTTGIYHSTGDFSITSLNEKEIEYIRSVSYFGYGYKDHNDYRYYMATQEIIWEYLTGIDVVWTNELSVNGARIDISSYKEDIFKDRSEYYKEIDFDVLVKESYSLGTNFILSDINNVISDYKIVSNVHSLANIDGNSLVIDILDDYIGEEKIILKKDEYYNYDSELYYYDNSQKLISNGNFKIISEEVSFRIEGFKIKGQVIDQDTLANVPLGQATFEGAVYELYNENRELLDIYTTNVDGTFYIENLPYGVYYVKQIKASEGYLLNSDEIMIELYEGDLELRLEQKLISNVVEIKKVYGNNEKYIPEDNILFQIFDYNGDLYEEILTNNEGIATVWLPYGNYLFHQESTTLGYSKVLDFEVVIDKEQSDKLFYNLVNEFIGSKVKIRTFQQDSGKTFFDGIFTYRIRKSGESNYLEFEGNDIFETNQNGELVLPMIFSYGDYILEQVSVPKGVFKNSNSLEFTIDDQTDLQFVDGDLFIELDVFNQFIMGSLEFLSNEEVFYISNNDYDYKKEPRVETPFSLVANQDIIVNGEILYHEGEEIQDVSTDSKGLAMVENLYLGSYCLIDLSTEQRECFSFESNSSNEKEILKKIEMTIFSEKADIVIQNQNDYGENIEKSVFELYKDDNLIYTGITNEEGIIQIKDLVHGTYCIKQKSVSSAYELVQDRECIVLDNDQIIDFINKKIGKNKIAIPDTFSDVSSWVIFINVVFLIGMIIFVYKKIFINNY